MELRIKSFNIYYEGSLKNLIFKRVTKTQYLQGELHKCGGQGGGFGQFADLWGARSKRGDGVFKVEG